MKKALIYTLLVAIAILLVSPYIAGKKLKEGYLAQMDSLPEQPGVTLNNETYDLGWFQSDVVTRVDLDLAKLTGEPELADSPVSFLVESRFSHGPVLFTDSGVRFGLGYGQITFLPAAENVGSGWLDWLAQAPIEIRSLVYFDKLSLTEMELPAYQSGSGNEHIRFGGAYLSLSANSDMTRFESSLIIQPSSVVGKTGTISVDESSGSMSYSGGTPYALVGETVFDFNGISVVEDQVSVSIDNVRVNGGSQRNGDTMDFFQTVEFENIQASIPVTGAKWHFELNSVPVRSLELWADIAYDFEHASATDPAVSEAFYNKLQLLSDSLLPGIHMQNRFDIEALGANHEFNLQVTYLGSVGSANLFAARDPGQLMQVFAGTLLVKLNEQAMLGSPFEPMLTPYVQQGLLIPIEEDLVLDATLKDGELVVNGHLIPVLDMLQSAMAD